MDCKFESVQEILGKEKAKKQNRNQKKNPQQEQIRVTTNKKQKVGDCHSENLISSLTITSTIQNPFCKMSVCVELAECRTGEHQGERVGYNKF